MHKILIVEDESVIRTALRRLLERNGYQISEAGSVQSAEREHNLGDFDLVISDLRLPGAPGTAAPPGKAIQSARRASPGSQTLTSLKERLDDLDRWRLSVGDNFGLGARDEDASERDDHQRCRHTGAEPQTDRRARGARRAIDPRDCGCGPRHRQHPRRVRVEQQ